MTALTEYPLGKASKFFLRFLSNWRAVVDSITVQKNDIDFSAHVTRIQGHAPDEVAIAAQAEQAANIVRELRRQGLNIPVMTGVECANPLFIKAGQSAVEGGVHLLGHLGGQP